MHATMTYDAETRRWIEKMHLLISAPIMLAMIIQSAWRVKHYNSKTSAIIKYF